MVADLSSILYLSSLVDNIKEWQVKIQSRRSLHKIQCLIVMKRMCWTLGVYLHHKARIRCGLKCLNFGFVFNFWALVSIWFLVGKSLPFLSPLLYQIKIIRYARAALDPFHYLGRKDSRPLCAAPYKDSRRPYLCPLGLRWRPALIRIDHVTSTLGFLILGMLSIWN